ncbi:MAG TPA: hypothetical protein PKD34_03650, partial [Candidatus Doudnabacteria bacterium]|nr:hypothetical protein [Candidatus Doudnabacteria bacterium]
NAKFVTLIFYKNSKKTNTPHNKPQYRQDILAGQLQQQTDAYIRKISSLLSNEQALIDFRTLVNNANAPMISKIKASITKQKIYSSLNKIAIFITIILIIAVSGLNFYWNNINSYFYGIIYDSKIFAAQTAATLGLITLLISLVRNK